MEFIEGYLRYWGGLSKYIYVQGNYRESDSDSQSHPVPLLKRLLYHYNQHYFSFEMGVPNPFSIIGIQV